MQRFYQNWQGKRPGEKPMPKAEALREAKRWLRGLTDVDVQNMLTRGVQARASPPIEKQAQPYAHPHFWAGFILTGDPD